MKCVIGQDSPMHFWFKRPCNESHGGYLQISGLTQEGISSPTGWLLKTQIIGLSCPKKSLKVGLVSDSSSVVGHCSHFPNNRFTIPHVSALQNK